MEIHPLLLQFGGSLVAIFALFLVARAMKLGGQPLLGDEDAVRAAAGEVEDGFEAVRVAISREGRAALAKDAEGRIMVIKRHGNRFAGRILTPAARVREVVDGIVVEPADPRFGRVTLRLERASAWVDAINRL